ncbi:hypothetical protein [Mesorhizobium sp.]|uniref:hypothetical protein n=1 Tax=Mesorhizobium sp. TaxID=1871066 RepID=UPI0025CD8D57|nr:hypothetical protein [Mesorhizobium sp.]
MTLDPLLGYPEEGSLTLSFIRASKGVAYAVGDAEIREAMIDLAHKARSFL